jgi:hypothetical protein
VTVRITVTGGRAARRIRVEGRLSGEEVGELEQVIGDDPGAACLELANLRSVDDAGLALLRRLRREGVVMCGVRPHLAWRIEEDEP